jgi:hypothetical protein
MEINPLPPLLISISSRSSAMRTSPFSSGDNVRRYSTGVIAVPLVEVVDAVVISSPSQLPTFYPLSWQTATHDLVGSGHSLRSAGDFGTFTGYPPEPSAKGTHP